MWYSKAFWVGVKPLPCCFCFRWSTLHHCLCGNYAYTLVFLGFSHQWLWFHQAGQMLVWVLALQTHYVYMYQSINDCRLKLKMLTLAFTALSLIILSARYRHTLGPPTQVNIENMTTGKWEACANTGLSLSMWKDERQSDFSGILTQTTENLNKYRNLSDILPILPIDQLVS